MRISDWSSDVCSSDRLAHLSPDLLNFCLPEFRHAPIASKAANMACKIGEQPAPIGCVDHLGMKLHPVKFAFFVSNNGKGSPFGDGDNLKTGRESCDLIAVAHPDLMPLALFPEAIKQSTALDRKSTRLNSSH